MQKFGIPQAHLSSGGLRVEAVRSWAPFRALPAFCPLSLLTRPPFHPRFCRSWAKPWKPKTSSLSRAQTTSSCSRWHQGVEGTGGIGSLRAIPMSSACQPCDFPVPSSYHPHSVLMPSLCYLHTIPIPPLFHPHSICISFPCHPHPIPVPPPHHPHSIPIPFAHHANATLMPFLHYPHAIPMPSLCHSHPIPAPLSCHP